MLSDDGLMRLAAKQAIASNPKILWVLLGLKFMRSMVSRQKALVPLTTWLLGSWLLAFVALAQVEDAQPGSTSQTDKDRLPEAGLADQAFWNSRQAQGIQPMLRTWSAPTTWSLTRKKLDEQQRVFLVKVAKDLETQARFESAVAALKLHYGIAACTMGLEIQSQAESYLNEQIAVEKELIQLGCSPRWPRRASGGRGTSSRPASAPARRGHRRHPAHPGARTPPSGPGGGCRRRAGRSARRARREVHAVSADLSGRAVSARQRWRDSAFSRHNP